uniref:Uncharacterized protein n=1 Tax=Esox lucius TaxID=8010 RepID=A0A3P8Y3P3_ESOLU
EERQVTPLVDAFRGGTSVQAELQILRSVVGVGHLLWDAHRQGQIAAQLPYDDRHADVAGVQLNVAAGATLRDPQGPYFPGGVAVIPVNVVAGVSVVRHSLVNTLLCTVFKRLEYDGDLGADDNVSDQPFRCHFNSAISIPRPVGIYVENKS